ncbi:hypothetical protein [Rhizobium sp. OAE497]|jgi:hypothetical protein|uniref:hypothetical protein n=1 Tax=unclassified Rhizobium TaxID=2613769 RepID=UPI000DD8A4B2
MSPWNIISRFRSKKDVSKATVVSPVLPVSSEASAMEDHFDGLPVAQADDTTAPPDPVAVMTSPDDHTVTPVGSPAAEAAAVAEAEEKEVTATAPASEISNSQKSKRPTYDIRASKKARKGPRITLKGKETGTQPPSAAPMQTSDQDGYLDAVYGLDDDIKQLRAALAQKLETQNGQLRNMLSRFEDR